METGINGDQIVTLKRQLFQETDLSKFWEYYFTNFAENPTFRAMGAPCRNDTIENLLQLFVRKLSGRDSIVIEDLLLVEIPEFHLIHGCCYLQDRLTCILYFPDMKAGIIARLLGHNGQITFARVSQPSVQSLGSATMKIQ